MDNNQHNPSPPPTGLRHRESRTVRNTGRSGRQTNDISRNRRQVTLVPDPLVAPIPRMQLALFLTCGVRVTSGPSQGDFEAVLSMDRGGCLGVVNIPFGRGAGVRARPRTSLGRLGAVTGQGFGHCPPGPGPPPVFGGSVALEADVAAPSPPLTFGNDCQLRPQPLLSPPPPTHTQPKHVRAHRGSG